MGWKIIESYLHVHFNAKNKIKQKSNQFRCLNKQNQPNILKLYPPNKTQQFYHITKLSTFPIQMQNRPSIYNHQLSTQLPSHLQHYKLMKDKHKLQLTESSIDHSHPIQIQLQEIEPNTISLNTSQPSQQPSKTPALTYRPDIDGLRAVAIVLVLIYHAYPQSLPGGYIGVDVFFVISGYLISQIIIKQTLKEKFTYRDFYLRRIKRIIPTLLVVLAATLFVVWKYCQLDQTILTLNTLDASLIFSANLQVLFHQKGYFDADTHSNFLLHLWSLGVEQQFYIFWPCILSIVLTKYKKNVLAVLGGYAGCSFVLSIACVYVNQKFAFYFPFCRFWQMAVGGILAYLNFSFKGSTINNVISAVSLIAILASSFLLNQASLFPGFWALLPTLGAACIIQAKQKALINQHILSSKPIMFVGKISYSLYLWHWPLLVFSRTFYPPGSESLFASTPFILLLCVVLSCLTYFFVENPVRKSPQNRKIVTVLISLMFIIVAISITIGVYIWLGHWVMNKEYAESYFQKVDQEMRPRQGEDFVVKNGRKHPNLSKSANRLKPTVDKIKAARLDMEYDVVNHQEFLLGKKILAGSPYYEEDMPEMDDYEILNQGRENKLLIVGDSHAMRLSYRFQQLHKESVQKNMQEQFPTVIGMYHASYALNNQREDFLNFALHLVEKHNIKRVLLVSHWLIYWCVFLQQPAPECHLKSSQQHIQQMMVFVNRFQALGAEVAVLTIDFDLEKLHPKNMIDFTGVIQKNIQPFRLSEFKTKFKMIIEPYEAAIRQNNATVIDLSDNLCYEDWCHVVSPTGYAPYTDGGHYGKFYAKHWLSVLDYLVEF